MNLKTYTALFEDDLMPGTLLDCFFAIRVPQRKITLKSIIWSVRYKNFGTGQKIPIDNITEVFTSLRVGTAGTIYTGAVVDLGTGTTGPYLTGGFITLHEPGQYNFDWSDFFNDLNFYYIVNNVSAATRIVINSDFYFNITDKITYL